MSPFPAETVRHFPEKNAGHHQRDRFFRGFRHRKGGKRGRKKGKNKKKSKKNRKKRFFGLKKVRYRVN
jgi:hypothetical protein